MVLCNEAGERSEHFMISICKCEVQFKQMCFINSEALSNQTEIASLSKLKLHKSISLEKLFVSDNIFLHNF